MIFDVRGVTDFEATDTPLQQTKFTVNEKCQTAKNGFA